METFDPSLITQVLNEAGREYLTACQNHVVLNMTGRVKKAFRLFLDDEYPDMRAPDKWKLVRHFIDRLSQRSTTQEEEAVWNSLRDPVQPELRESASTYMAEQEAAHRDLPLDVPNEDSRVQRAWWKYLPWLASLSFFPKSGWYAMS